MLILIVANGFTAPLDGLGRDQNFPNLSEKRVTKAVRQALRGKYGHDRVSVSCDAIFERGEWMGGCEIDLRPYGYRIHG